MTNDGLFPRPIPIAPVPVPETADQEEDALEEILRPAEYEPNTGQEQPEEDGKVSWVGSPATPRKADDGISDLFETGTKGEEDDLRDLTTVDVDADIIDADPDTGDLSDLTDVTEEDVLGDEDTGQFPDATPYQQRLRKTRARPVRKTIRRPPPPTMGGLSV